MNGPPKKGNRPADADKKTRRKRDLPSAGRSTFPDGPFIGPDCIGPDCIGPDCIGPDCISRTLPKS